MRLFPKTRHLFWLPAQDQASQYSNLEGREACEPLPRGGMNNLWLQREGETLSKTTTNSPMPRSIESAQISGLFN